MTTSDPGAVAAAGVVVIGRNEGERLRRCLESLSGVLERLVYVDSGSSDDSVAMSRARGVTVVELDMQTPFTAARARNAGFDALLAAHPGLGKVFFVDGDCEVMPGWLPVAAAFLDEHPDVAVVSGRLRERFPGGSIYNRLCDMEWGDHPAGRATLCGGNAVFRIDAFRRAHGFRPGLICGEEPELCVRLRAAGWIIWQLDEPMALHDAAIHRFGQWWKRMIRTGYAFAAGAALHGSPPERHWVHELNRAWVWGLGVPLATLLACAWIGWPALLLLLVYPLQVVRLTLRGRRSCRDNLLQAGSQVLGRFAEVTGVLKFTLDRWRRSKSRLIEYK